ncbi:MAG: DUF3363 domain-containing protein [Bacteroidales bacterium]|nr:DUF3363 domain-containing protein [Bacteroidales bacterium]
MTFDPLDPVDLTARLIRCPSVTPADGGAIALLAEVLGAAGFSCTRVDRGGIANLYARWGKAGANRAFGFNGHTDVVPVGDATAWRFDPFGAEVKDAMDHRAEHLVRQGLAERQCGRVIFNRNLIDTLRQREVAALGEQLARDTGRPFTGAMPGHYVAGTYQQRFALASGRFAMIDDGLGFQLVPWTPSLETHLGRHVSGVARTDGGIDWSFGRNRGLGR